MNYRILGRTGLKVSTLGFGCMRLPDENGKAIDSLGIPMLRKAVEMGVNYFDTAVGYINRDSQRIVGDALHDLRDKVILSTKNPVKNIADLDEWWKNLEDSLRLLRTDHIDIYNVHGMKYEFWESDFDVEGGIMSALLSAKEQGMIRHICFSTHDTPDNVIKLADLDFFESVTLQYNLLNRANERVIEHLKKKNMGVVAMGPVGGGRLGYQTVEGKAGGATSAQLALKFVISNPDVSLALSGMSEMSMLDENVALASQDLSLSVEEEAEIKRATASQANLAEFYCPACGYCMPCPSGVDIPENLTLIQLDQAYGITPLARERYGQTAGRARFCIKCDKCLEKCPQNLKISDLMAQAVESLDPEAGQPALEAKVTGVNQADDGLELIFDIVAFNITDKDIEGELSLQVAGGEALRRSVSLKAGMHKHIKAEAKVAIGSAAGPIAYRAEFDVAGTLAEADGIYKALFAQRIASGQTPEADQATIHGPARAIWGDKKLGKSRKTSFRVACDGESLILVADVDEEISAPADAEAEKRDCLQLFLDCRGEEDLRKGPYGQGCARLRLAPGLDGQPAKIEPMRAIGLDFSDAAIKSAARTGGYSIETRIPLSALKLAPGRKLIGFDLAQHSVDASGKMEVTMLWAGTRQNNNGTGHFGLVFLDI